MMRRFACVALGLLVLAAIVGTAAPAIAQQNPIEGLPPIPMNNPDSTELVNRMNVTGDVTKGLYYDGKRITFHGEAIGEHMIRGAYAWIHLNDDAYMERNVEEGASLGGYNSGMAVWVPTDLITPIDSYGDYKTEGSIVEVEGVFHGACSEHGGDMDIHATSLKVLRAGHPAIDYIRPWKIYVAIGLILIAAAFYWLDRRRRARVLEGRVR
jgi:hypothetical protein